VVHAPDDGGGVPLSLTDTLAVIEGASELLTPGQIAELLPQGGPAGKWLPGSARTATTGPISRLIKTTPKNEQHRTTDAMIARSRSSQGAAEAPLGPGLAPGGTLGLAPDAPGVLHGGQEVLVEGR
jgi:hypothetical protein